MQVLDTHVSNSSDGTVTVEFKGEGREQVSVTMVDGNGSLDGDQAVLRAKEIMVQLTAFDDDGLTETMRRHSGEMTSRDLQSEAEPLPNATPGSHLRAD